MSDDRSLLADRAAELRLDFDRSFAEPRRPDPPPSEGLLEIRLGGEPYAIRLSAINGVFADQKVTRMPGSIAALLGIAGLRGKLVPVYDLAMLLGHPPTETPRWLAVASDKLVALAFATLDGHTHFARDAIMPHEASGQARAHVREIVRVADRIRPLVHMPSILETITRLVSESRSGER